MTPSPPSAGYVAARFYLLLEAFVEGERPPSHADLDWAVDLLDRLALPQEILDEAEADHHQLMLAPARR